MIMFFLDRCLHFDFFFIINTLVCLLHCIINHLDVHLVLPQ